jgi:hypothetical protein
LIERPNRRLVFASSTIPLKTNSVNSVNLGSIALRHKVWRNVLTNHCTGAYHSDITKANELMNTGKPTYDHPIANYYVAG